MAIILDIDMPVACSTCPCFDYEFINCQVIDEKADWGTYDKKRLDNCPLKEEQNGESKRFS